MHEIMHAQASDLSKFVKADRWTLNGTLDGAAI